MCTHRHNAKQLNSWVPIICVCGYGGPSNEHQHDASGTRLHFITKLACNIIIDRHRLRQTKRESSELHFQPPS